MPTKVVEGQVGSAIWNDELIYPSVTSCLTITCITADGAKWGAHLSMFPLQRQTHGRGVEDYNPSYKVMLSELRSLMSTGKALSDVRKVWVVGMLDGWTDTLRPASSDQDRMLYKSDNQPHAAQLIAERLVLHYLTVNDTHFQFRNWSSGDVKFGTGASADAIRPWTSGGFL